MGKSTWAQICADVPRGKNRQQCRPPALGYSKPLNAISMHVDEDDKTTTLIQGTGSNYMLPKLEAKGREWGRLLAWKL